MAAIGGRIGPTMQRQRTAHAVWEITLRCNLACQHCGSRAGPARQDELSTAEALDLVAQLHDVGITEVSLIGGEAFLRKDWLVIARAITDAGMRATMVTGGFGMSSDMVAGARDAGIDVVSVSVDGLEATHDRLRGRTGSYRSCLSTMERLQDAGIVVGCNTQLNRLSMPELPVLYERLRDAGMRAWQVQLTGPMGHAADHADILLQPAELVDVFPVLARLARRAWRDGVQFRPNDNVGYYGPYERLLRGNSHPWAFWQGPREGLTVIGIESDGSVKADPTLPSDPYRGGNVRQRPLREILERSPALTFNAGGGTPEGRARLWGFCATCEFADVCRGGAAWIAHTFFDRRGNNPYCHHRALAHQHAGRRERVVLHTPAQGEPYDHGVFALVEEPADAPWPADDALHFTSDAVVWPSHWGHEHPLSTPPADVDERAIGWLEPRQSAGPLLPREGWSNRMLLLQALLRVKRALDVAETAATEGPTSSGAASA
jgi:radical SAM protein with 4Fe4S-binding SPASM domain